MNEKRVLTPAHKGGSGSGRSAVTSGRLLNHTLLTVSELETRRRELSDVSRVRDWRWAAYEEVKKHATKADFPCFFAAKAFESEAPLCFFAESTASEESRIAIARALPEYLEIVGKKSGWDAASSVLFVIFKPQHPVRSLETYHNQAWQLLTYLHHHDPAPWPKEIPTNLDDPDWTFCFSGIPIFVNISCPAHHNRQSRNLGDTLALVMQPRTAFDEVAGNTPSGLKVRKRIRTRIRKYDLLDPSPALGAYGDPKNREWAQYGLAETNDTIPATCPYERAFKKK